MTFFYAHIIYIRSQKKRFVSANINNSINNDLVLSIWLVTPSKQKEYPVFNSFMSSPKKVVKDEPIDHLQLEVGHFNLVESKFKKNSYYSNFSRAAQAAIWTNTEKNKIIFTSRDNNGTTCKGYTVTPQNPAATFNVVMETDVAPSILLEQDIA